MDARTLLKAWIEAVETFTEHVGLNPNGAYRDPEVWLKNMKDRWEEVFSPAEPIQILATINMAYPEGEYAIEIHTDRYAQARYLILEPGSVFTISPLKEVIPIRPQDLASLPDNLIEEHEFMMTDDLGYYEE